MANRKHQNLGSSSRAEEKLRRHQAIVAYLSSAATPRSTSRIHQAIGSDAYVLRTVQRDLQELADKGVIEEQDGEWMAVGDRLEEGLDRLLSIVALQVFHSVMSESLPASLRRSVQALLDRKSRLLDAPHYSDTPELHWLRALRIDPGYAWLEKPVVDRAVRAGIEEAISTRRKAWVKAKPLQYGPWWHTNDEVLVSISHVIVTPPDRMAVAVWLEEDATMTDVFGDEDVQSRQCVWPLEYLDNVRVTNEPASFDGTWEPPTSHGGRFGAVGDDWKTYVLRISPFLEEEMTGTELLKRLVDPKEGGQYIGTDASGWRIYRLACPPDPSAEFGRFARGMDQFLSEHAEDIEVLAPFDARMAQRARALRVLSMYNDAQDVDVNVVEALWLDHEAEQLAEVGGFLRVRYHPQTGMWILPDGNRVRTSID